MSLSQAIDVPGRSLPADSSFESPSPEGAELAGDGFGAQGLLVGFPDETSAVEWRFAGHEITAGELAIRLRDRHYPLEATLHYRVHDDSDVIVRWTTLRHTGESGGPLRLTRTDSATWTAPLRRGLPAQPPHRSVDRGVPAGAGRTADR